jgi:hypothetical protein
VASAAVKVDVDESPHLGSISLDRLNFDFLFLEKNVATLRIYLFPAENPERLGKNYELLFSALRIVDDDDILPTLVAVHTTGEP